jgi:lambda family phage tail tape measure protein
MAKAIETLSIKLEFKDAGTQQIINKLNSSFKGLERVISGNTKPAIQKLRSEINSFAATGNKSISTIESQVTALRALRREADINSKEFKQLTADISKYEKQLGKAQGRRPARGGRALAATQMAGAAISGGIFGGPEGFGGAVLGGAIGGVPGAFAGAAIGAQVGMIRQSLGGVAETVAEINSMKIALAGVSESAEDYRQSFNNVIEISKQFLFPVDRAIGEFTRLKAAVVGAGFGTQEATDVFKGFAAAILATGGNSEKLSGALLAASQVFSKGKVQAEELRGQIGERLPGAFTTFAQSIGVSSRDLDEMLRKGEVSTENFVEFTRTLFSRYEKTAETLGSSPEKAGQRLQLALSLATLEYGGFFQKVGAGFQDYLTNLVKFAVNNKETFKKVAANVVVFAQDVKDVVKGIVNLAKEAFGGLFSFLGNALKVFAQQIVMPFVNTILAAINEIANRVKLGQAERKLGGPFGRAGEIRLEELERYKKEEGITAPGRAGVSLAGGDEIERRAQQRILEEAGMGPKSRESRLSAALSNLDKAFAQFAPTSFGTSLGDKPLPSGEDQDTGDGSGTKSTLARRIEQAQALESRMERQLLLAQQQGEIGRLLAKQANERSQLQERITALTKDGTSADLEKITASAENLLLKKQEEEREEAIKSLRDQANIQVREAIIAASGLSEEEMKRLDIMRTLAAFAAKFKEVLTDEEMIKALELLRGALQKVQDKADDTGDSFDDTFKKGLQDMINVGPKLAKVALNAIGSVTDGLIEMAVTGKANFKEMAVSILKDLAKIMLRAAMARIVAGAFGIQLEKGGVIQGGQLKPFAKGGVVAGPTIFPMAGGNVGLMGEAGPEAVMPLRRGANGRLGVEVANQSNAIDAMNRYSRKGGLAQMDRADSSNNESVGSPESVNRPIDVRYTVERINNVDYVTADQFQAGMRQAANQGAKQGEQQTLKRLQMSGSTRKRLGM